MNPNKHGFTIHAGDLCALFQRLPLVCLGFGPAHNPRPDLLHQVSSNYQYLIILQKNSYSALPNKMHAFMYFSHPGITTQA